HGIGHGLGGLAERDGETPGRQRIERAGMARFGRIEEAPNACDGLGRGHSFRLIENDPAVNGRPFTLARHHCPSLPGLSGAERSRATFSECRILAMRSASAKEVSSTKRSSG